MPLPSSASTAIANAGEGEESAPPEEGDRSGGSVVGKRSLSLSR